MEKQLKILKEELNNFNLTSKRRERTIAIFIALLSVGSFVLILNCYYYISIFIALFALVLKNRKLKVEMNRNERIKNDFISKIHEIETIIRNEKAKKYEKEVNEEVIETTFVEEKNKNITGEHIKTKIKK